MTSATSWPWPWEYGSWPTPAELWKGLNEAPPAERDHLLTALIAGAQEGVTCMAANHDHDLDALASLTELIRAEHTPETAVHTDHGGQDLITYCAGCGQDLDEGECKYLKVLSER